MSTEIDHDYTGERIRLVGTRVVHPEDQNQYVGRLDNRVSVLAPDGCWKLVPQFEKNEAATHFELFYDLWFVANLNVFASVHDITSNSSLESFIGYLVLLWTTWLITSIYDVRFTADSIFERCCKAIHLGVMVGFAEIGSSFDPQEQVYAVFRALSLFLMASRLALTVQYGVVALQTRKYAGAKKPLLITALVHFIAAVIYLGITFSYRENTNSKIYVVWYVVGVLEMTFHLVLSQSAEVLTFKDSHFGERLNLLTLIVLGEGVIILVKSITLVVKDTYLKDTTLTTWSPAMIGIVTASASLIYIIFQIYWDWMHTESAMSKVHQVWWAALHFPFHISLILLVEGSNQFIVWNRILESIELAMDELLTVRDDMGTEPSSENVATALREVVVPFLEVYKPVNTQSTFAGIDRTLKLISNYPDSFWIAKKKDPVAYAEWNKDVGELLSTMVNAIYAAFEYELPDEDKSVSPQEEEIIQTQTMQSIGARFKLVFIYTFVCAAIVVLFLTIMHVISKRKGWTPFNIMRTILCIGVALSLGLLGLISRSSVIPFMGSPWMLPTITIWYFLLLVLTHVPHPQTRWALGLRRRRRRRTSSGEEGMQKLGKRKASSVYEHLNTDDSYGRAPSETHLLKNVSIASLHDMNESQRHTSHRYALYRNDNDTNNTKPLRVTFAQQSSPPSIITSSTTLAGTSNSIPVSRPDTPISVQPVSFPRMPAIMVPPNDQSTENLISRRDSDETLLTQPARHSRQGSASGRRGRSLTTSTANSTPPVSMSHSRSRSRASSISRRHSRAHSRSSSMASSITRC